MPKKNKLPWMQLDVQDWLTSESVSSMSLAAQGAYIKLLCWAWCDDTCSITDNEKKLKNFLGVSQDEFLELWVDDLEDCFVNDEENDGRLYNPRQREEWQKALVRAEASRNNGKKGGRPVINKKPAKKKPVDKKPEKPAEPTAIGDIISSQPDEFSEGYDIEAEIREWVGEIKWEKSYGFFRWFLLEIPTAMDAISHIRRSKNPRIREVEKLTEVVEPDKYMRGWAKRHLGRGVRVPYDHELNRDYPNKVEIG